MNDKLQDALNEISDHHIAEAAKAKKKVLPYWLGAVAAILVAVLLWNVFAGPMVISANAISLASDPRVQLPPKRGDYESKEAWQEAQSVWSASAQQRDDLLQSAKSQLAPFFRSANTQFLSGSTGNILWSPTNAYIGLAMLSEVTAGDSQQQILDLLGAADTESLRQQVSAVWESVHADDGHNICTLANSLWLEEGLSYDQTTMDTLAYHHYASVYSGDLGSPKINKAIGSWLNNNTGGLLKKATDSISLTDDVVLALYSTLYFQAKWVDEFQSSNNTQSIFHAVSGDRDATFMNKKLTQMYYFWGDKFSAVALSLKNGSSMWFVLPDEGYTPDDVLYDGEYMDMILSGVGNWENSKYMKVNLSVPKFDVSSNTNLREGLKALGITDVFDPSKADFTAITCDTPVYLTAANQAVRLQIDEEGVKAAAYIEFPAAGSPAPPEEIIDFILDRPFIFAVCASAVPLFSGVVNEP